MENEATTNQPKEIPRKPASDSSDMSSVVAKLGAAERLIAVGAAILIADYLLFEVILDEYSFFTGTLLVAGYTLVAVWVRQSRPSAAWPLPYEWLLRVLGITAGFLGLIELLTDLRLGILDRPGDVIGGLLVYLGAFLMFWGGRQMKGASG